MKTPILSLEQFRAMKKRSDNLSEISGGAFEEGSCYVYASGLYIVICPDGSLELPLSRDVIEGAASDLPKLEELLYQHGADEGCYHAPPAERVPLPLAESTILTALRVAAEIYDRHSEDMDQHERIRTQFRKQAKEARATLALIEGEELSITEAEAEAPPPALRPHTLKRLRELSRLATEIEYGSEPQIAADNGFHELADRYLTRAQRRQLEAYSLKATVDERIALVLSLLGIESQEEA